MKKTYQADRITFISMDVTAQSPIEDEKGMPAVEVIFIRDGKMGAVYGHFSRGLQVCENVYAGGGPYRIIVTYGLSVVIEKQ